MIQSSDPEAGQAYTRASVEAYLRAATEERARIEAAIVAARSRTAWALREEEHLGSLAPGSGTVPGDHDAGAADSGCAESLMGRLPFPVVSNGRVWREPDLPTAVARD
jgi:hypothetical protein